MVQISQCPKAETTHKTPASKPTTWIKTSTGYLLQIRSYAWKCTWHFAPICVVGFFALAKKSRCNTADLTICRSGCSSGIPDLWMVWSPWDLAEPSKSQPVILLTTNELQSKTPWNLSFYFYAPHYTQWIILLTCMTLSYTLLRD